MSNTKDSAESLRRRHWSPRLLAAAGAAALALMAPAAGTAHADKIDGNGPYVWDCGSSRAGGVHVEAYGETVTVAINNQGSYVYHGNVAVDVEGGSSGSASVFVSNDGGFSPNTHAFCSPRP